MALEQYGNTPGGATSSFLCMPGLWVMPSPAGAWLLYQNVGMPCRESQAQPISGARPTSMPAASPEDNLPFLLDEDPSRGSSRAGSQGGSSVHAAAALQLPQQQHLAQQPQPAPQQLQQQRRAWSTDLQPGMQVKSAPFHK